MRTNSSEDDAQEKSAEGSKTVSITRRASKQKHSGPIYDTTIGSCLAARDQAHAAICSIWKSILRQHIESSQCKQLAHMFEELRHRFPAMSTLRLCANYIASPPWSSHNSASFRKLPNSATIQQTGTRRDGLGSHFDVVAFQAGSWLFNLLDDNSFSELSESFKRLAFISDRRTAYDPGATSEEKERATWFYTDLWKFCLCLHMHGGSSAVGVIDNPIEESIELLTFLELLNQQPAGIVHSEQKAKSNETIIHSLAVDLPSANKPKMGRPVKTTEEDQANRLVGKNIRERMSSLGMTHGTLADKLNGLGGHIELSTVQGHINGDHCQRDWLDGYGVVLGCDRDDLLEGVPPHLRENYFKFSAKQNKVVTKVATKVRAL